MSVCVSVCVVAVPLCLLRYRLSLSVPRFRKTTRPELLEYARLVASHHQRHSARLSGGGMDAGTGV